MAARTVIDSPRIVMLTVDGTDAVFPVGRVFCIGRNYAAHAREMGGDPTREPPFHFQKPATALDQSGRFPYPPGSSDVHHEVELVVCLGAGGSDIDAATALDHVYGYGVGLDMTKRDRQDEAKKAGGPWEIAKAFDHSAPCGKIAPADRVGHPDRASITLLRNGNLVQEGTLDQQIWSVAEIIAHLSTLVRLQAGDVIMTGTPSGVGPVARGDRLVAQVAGLPPLAVEII